MGLGGKKGALNNILFSYTRMQEAVTEGRNQELLRLYQPCFEDLMLYCLGKCRDKEMAQDAAAETLKAFLEHPNPQAIPNLKAWLLSVAHNISIKMLDKQIRRRNILDRISPTFKRTEILDVPEQMDQERLNGAIQNFLKEKDYQIWKMEGEGYKDWEIAERLQMNPKTVANRKSMIKKQIKEKFGRYPS